MNPYGAAGRAAPHLVCTHLSGLVAADSLDIQVTEGMFKLQSNTGCRLENRTISSGGKPNRADEATEKRNRKHFAKNKMNQQQLTKLQAAVTSARNQEQKKKYMRKKVK